MPIPQDFELDRCLVRRRFAAAAGRLAEADFLAREVGERMASRLDYVRHEPQRLLDIGCGLGKDEELLARRYPKARYLGLDFALPVLLQDAPPRWQRFFTRRKSRSRICADALHLPLAHQSVDMAWSNLALHWLHDPLPAFHEVHRVLRVGGLFMFATLGPDTLRELREAMPTASGERVHRFIDMHDLGDALVRAGFAEPVMDMDRITLTYASLDDLFRDLRAAAAGNASLSRPHGLSGKAGWQQARASYEQRRHDGRLPATFEIVFGHAWKPAPKQIGDGRAIIQFHGRKP